MFVKRPSWLFTPIGSAATSASVGWVDVTGNSNASTCVHNGSLARASVASRSKPAKASDAVNAAPFRTIERTVGSTSGTSSSLSPKANQRSASHGPEYRRSAASSSGPTSTATTEPSFDACDESLFPGDLVQRIEPERPIRYADHRRTAAAHTEQSANRRE